MDARTGTGAHTSHFPIPRLIICSLSIWNENTANLSTGPGGHGDNSWFVECCFPASILTDCRRILIVVSLDNFPNIFQASDSVMSNLVDDITNSESVFSTVTIQGLANTEPIHVVWTKNKPSGDHFGESYMVCRVVSRSPYSLHWGSRTPGQEVTQTPPSPRTQTQEEV